MKKQTINTTPYNNNSKFAKYTKKITNWREYNQSLMARGNISIYITEALSSKAFLKPKRLHQVGHPQYYRDELILLILTIRELLHLPLRQTIGLVAGLLQDMAITWQLPDYSTLSRRMGKLEVDFCRNFRRNLHHNISNKNIVLLLDSSGFKVFGEGEWKVRKHGYSYRRTWRETHIAIDYETRNIIGLINTKSGVHDNTQLKPLLAQVQKKHKIKTIRTIIGDGAYDSKDNYLMARDLNVEFIAPPPKNATEHLNIRPSCYEISDTPGWEDRNATIRHIEQWGLDGWAVDVGYHRRSLVENSFYRLKIIFGNNLKSRTDGNQYTEQCIRASLINRFNNMGLPRYAT